MSDSRNHSLIAVQFEYDNVFVGITDAIDPMKSAKRIVSRVKSTIKHGQPCNTKLEQFLFNNQHLIKTAEYKVHKIHDNSVDCKVHFNIMIKKLRMGGFNVLNMLGKDTTRVIR